MEALPTNLLAERMVLGSVLLQGERMAEIYTALGVEDFATVNHQNIWKAMRTLFDSGTAIDRITVFTELNRTNAKIELNYLVSLDDEMPANANLDAYIVGLKEKTALRRIALICQKVMSNALGGTMKPEDIKREWQADIETVKSETAPPGLISTRELIQQVGVDELLRPLEEVGLRLPWTELNRILCGFRPGQMVVIGAYTGRGKTSAGLQIATHATRQAAAPLYWTLEMPPKMLFRRVVNQLAGLDNSRSRKRSLTFDEREKERDACAWVNDHPLYFESRAKTVPEFCASLRRMKSQANLGLVVVDYLQLIRHGRAESRTREVGENSRSLKLAAMEFGVPFVVLSQFRRPSDANRPPTLHDLKESGDVENDADVVLLMHSAELSGDQPTHVRVHIAKQREGPAGFDVDLTFDPRCQLFTSEAA